MKKAISQLLGGNMLSKVLGLVREVLMAKFFGTGDVNGAYRIAQTGTLVPIDFQALYVYFFRSDICIYIHCSVFFIRLLDRYHGSRNWRECA